MNKDTMGANVAAFIAWLAAGIASFQSLWYVDTDNPNVATVLVLVVYFVALFRANKYFVKSAKMFPAALEAWKAARGN